MVVHIRAMISHIAVAGQVSPSFLEPSLLHGFLLPWFPSFTTVRVCAIKIITALNTATML